MDTKTRILKGIKFFRQFSDKASLTLYKKSVLKFCDLVESYLKTDDQVETAKEIFND